MSRKNLLNHGWLVFHDPAGYTGLPLWFKGFLIFGIAVIASVLAYYTQEVVGQLKTAERRMANDYAEQWRKAVEAQSEAVTGFLFEQIIRKRSFPLVVTDPDNNPMHWRELHDVIDSDSIRTPDAIEKVRKIVAAMDEYYPPVPIEYEGRLLHYIHYGNYRLIRNLRLLPFLEVGLVVLFLLIAYIGFRNLKRAEQRYIWVGMAKETAHQLGTPISSLIGWVEMLKMKLGEGAAADGRGDLADLVGEIEEDIGKLSKNTSRFAQIGSVPDLMRNDVNDMVREVVAYFKDRLPQGDRRIEIVSNYGVLPKVLMNRDLIGWVLENLLKNSLDAIVKKEGVIEIETDWLERENKVRITHTDNGKGIRREFLNKIFEPGFSTKRRGWGLGLALARRIVTEYHFGKIYVDSTQLDRGTTFVIELPVKDAEA